MAQDSSSLEQSVSRALRENLEKLQRTTSELNEAIADLVAACGSSRPGNALPPAVRAQSAAAALAASLDVLTRVIAATLQVLPTRGPAESEPVRAVSVYLPEPEPVAPAPPNLPVPMAETVAAVEEPPAEAAAVEEPPLGPSAAFQVSSLPSEQQEMHRRANRVAKVSMQDIKMLRPEQVRLGREHKDLCVRLRDDIENARKEYDRRFRAILDHPVDYFYHWMVEILANGDREALGEYPYSSPALRR